MGNSFFSDYFLIRTSSLSANSGGTSHLLQSSCSLSICRNTSATNSGGILYSLQSSCSSIYYANSYITSTSVSAIVAISSFFLVK